MEPAALVALARRVRWGNVAPLVALGVLVALSLLWPQLTAPPPALPPAGAVPASRDAPEIVMAPDPSSGTPGGGGELSTPAVAPSSVSRATEDGPDQSAPPAARPRPKPKPKPKAKAPRHPATGRPRAQPVRQQPPRFAPVPSPRRAVPTAAPPLRSRPSASRAPVQSPPGRSRTPVPPSRPGSPARSGPGSEFAPPGQDFGR